MRNKNKYVILTIALALGLGSIVLSTTNLKTMAAVKSSPALTTSKYPSRVEVANTDTKTYYFAVTPTELVAKSSQYLNKSIVFKANFDKFSTLGLNYPPAMRSSDEYISFLIQKPDVKDHTIPYSELKLFLKRSVAEKYIDINAGDSIEVKGKVFSTALGDTWVDVTSLTILTTKSKPNTK